MAATRARRPSGRIKYRKENPPRIPMVCIICGRTFMKRKGQLRPRQMTISCPPACVTLNRMLWSLFEYPNSNRKKGL
jgi:hypothetical protein